MNLLRLKHDSPLNLQLPADYIFLAIYTVRKAFDQVFQVTLKLRREANYILLDLIFITEIWFN